MFSWVSVLKLLLSVINNISQIIHDNALLSAGEAQAVAKSLVELQTKLGIGQEIDAEITLLSDAEARARLNEDARP